MANIKRPREKTANYSAFKLGDKVSHDQIHNCLSCVRWAFCKDTNKGFNYRCSRFNENSVDTTSLDDFKNAREFTEHLFNTNPSGPSIDYENVEGSLEKDSALEGLIEKALEENSPIPPDIKIRDGEIPIAENFYEWALSDKFAGGGQPPFPRQLYVASLLFAEVCPRCSDMDWFEHMKVDASLSRIESKVVFLKKGRCPECGVRRTRLVEKEELANPFELIMICGQRSAKTSSINLMDAYSLHRFLKLSNPAKVFKQLPQQMFVCTQTSATFGQARQNVWDPFLNILNSSPWYSNYNNFLMRRGQELGEELVVIADIYAKYRHRNIFLSPATPSGQTMRGKTRFMADIDEISHMSLLKSSGKDAVRGNARDTYIALRNSMDTMINAYKNRFEEGYYDLPKPTISSASSPLTLNDYGMQLLRMSKHDTAMLGFKYKTWEFNPFLPESFFASRFKNTPVEAARDYACEPPIGNSTWLPDLEVLTPAFGKSKNMYEIVTKVKRSKSNKKVTTAELINKIQPNLRWGCVLTLDVGSVNNSFAFAVTTVNKNFDLTAYLNMDDDSEESEAINVPIKTVFVGEIIPKKDREISQTSVFKDVISVLCTELPIKVLISDRWQNKKLSQDVEDQFGIGYIEKKLRWDDFENFKDALIEAEVELPRLKMGFKELLELPIENYPDMFKGRPLEHLAYQFMTVQESKGITVVKGDATDDMFRCIALAHSALNDKEVLELIEQVDEQQISSKRDIGFSTSNAKASPLNGSTFTPGGQSSPFMIVNKSSGRR